jgi:hypothetical protein
LFICGDLEVIVHFTQILSTHTFWTEPSNDNHSVDIFQISTTKLSSRFQKPNTYLYLYPFQRLMCRILLKFSVSDKIKIMTIQN